MLRAYVIEIRYLDPFPRKWGSQPIQARTPGRAMDFAYREFKKTRAKKRELQNLNVSVTRI